MGDTFFVVDTVVRAMVVAANVAAAASDSLLSVVTVAVEVALVLGMVV